jgi:hypothetical protein
MALEKERRAFAVLHETIVSLAMRKPDLRDQCLNQLDLLPTPALLMQ